MSPCAASQHTLELDKWQRKQSPGIFHHCDVWWWLGEGVFLLLEFDIPELFGLASINE